MYIRKYIFMVSGKKSRGLVVPFWRDQGRAVDPGVVEFVSGRWQCVSLSHEPHFLAVLNGQSLLVVVVLYFGTSFVVRSLCSSLLEISNCNSGCFTHLGSVGLLFFSPVFFDVISCCCRFMPGIGA